MRQKGRTDERTNDSHALTTEPDAPCIDARVRLNRGWPAWDLLIENRHGLIADAMATIAGGSVNPKLPR